MICGQIIIIINEFEFAEKPDINPLLAQSKTHPLEDLVGYILEMAHSLTLFLVKVTYSCS